jgi:hypothetical protein
LRTEDALGDQLRARRRRAIHGWKSHDVPQVTIRRREGGKAIATPVEIDYMDIHLLTASSLQCGGRSLRWECATAFLKRRTPSRHSFVTGCLNPDPAIVLDSSAKRFFFPIPSYNPLQVSGLAATQIFMIE